MNEHLITRRRALGLGVGGALAAAASACGSSDSDAGGGPSGSVSAGESGRPTPSTAATGASSGGASGPPLPTSSTNFPVKYDIPPSDNGVLPAFLFKYPENPVRTVTQTPASGGKVTAACEINTPVPTSMDSNPVWQAINKALGATLDIHYTPASGWPAKQQTLIASGDLPDIMQMGLSVPQLPDVLKSLFVDLAPYLGGDNVKKYPNLALLPETAWKQTVFSGGIYGIPQTRPRPGGAPLRTRKDILDKLGVDTTPTTGAEMVALFKAVADPKANRWASSTPTQCVVMFAEMLGAPNQWAMDGSKFVSQNASPEMAEALSQVAALWKAGALHPDSFSPGVFPKAFDAGRTVIEHGTFDPGVRYLLNSPDNPDYRIGFIVEPKFDGGGPAAAFLGSGFFGLGCISAKAKDRTEELLRVLDWCCAPIGSEESLLSKYGIKGRDYTLVDGVIKATPQAKSELMILGYLANASVVYVPTSPVIVPIYQDFHQAQADQYQAWTDNAALGLYSPTVFSGEAATAAKKLDDLISSVIQGRKGIKDWQAGVASWRKACGDKIASEYEQSYAQANG